MLGQTLIRKLQPVRDMKPSYGKSPCGEEKKVSIPDSWTLNSKQRSFIELMLDEKETN